MKSARFDACSCGRKPRQASTHSLSQVYERAGAVPFEWKLDRRVGSEEVGAFIGPPHGRQLADETFAFCLRQHARSTPPRARSFPRILCPCSSGSSGSRSTFRTLGRSREKEKRHCVRFRDRVRARFDVSIAEVDAQDLHQKAVFGVSVVSNEGAICERALEQVARAAELQEDAVLIDRATEVIPIGDELYGVDEDD